MTENGQALLHQWLRRHPLGGVGREPEQWTYRGEGIEDVISVHVHVGKAVDIKALKRNSSFRAEAARAEEIRHAFPDRKVFIPQMTCPVCREPISRARKSVLVWETQYYHCMACGHAYADEFPSEEALTAFYESHCADGSYYIRDEEIALRLEQVYLPKLDWVVNAYQRTHGRPPRSIMDLGAGAGHFLHGCALRGMEVAGVEYDEVYRGWCREKFGIELATRSSDLEMKPYDVVCSFNVIEHTADPASFLNTHKLFMGEDSLCVLETPKYNSLTTSVQRLFPEVVRTHLAPFKHNHLFSDASLATLLRNNGLLLSDIWYFGQDMTEVLFQAFNAKGIEVDMELVNAFMGAPQTALDAAGACDLMLVAARSARKPHGEGQ